MWSRVALHRWTGRTKTRTAAAAVVNYLVQTSRKGLLASQQHSSRRHVLRPGPDNRAPVRGMHSVTHISPSRRRKPRVGLLRTIPMYGMNTSGERSENKTVLPARLNSMSLHRATKTACMSHVRQPPTSPRPPNSIEMLRPVW